jgi:membrane-associated phospholipid phosphatase
MKNLLIQLKYYLIVCAFFLSLIIIGLLVYGKKTFNLIINQTNSPFQDFLFKYVTNFGNGFFAVFIILAILLFINYRNLFIGIVAFILSGLVCQLIKNIPYFSALRPAKEFGPQILHFVDGVKLNYFHSFPSGHTTSAFAVFMFLAFIFKNKYLQVLFAVTACLVGYSRVYLSQHFFIDVAFGVVLGITSFLVSYTIFSKIKVKWYDNKIKFNPN